MSPRRNTVRIAAMTTANPSSADFARRRPTGRRRIATVTAMTRPSGNFRSSDFVRTPSGETVTFPRPDER